MRDLSEPREVEEALPQEALLLKALPLESVLRTEELQRRSTRPPNYEVETQALAALVVALAESPRTILQTLVEKVVEVLQAGSAGLSLLTRDGERFYWAAIAGAWAPHLGGGTPRDFGPCGDVLDCNRPMLFTRWERRYPYLSAATPLAEEGLLVPFYVGGKAVGTIWAIAHDASRRFDAEDLRLLESLGRFASAAYQAVETQHAADQRHAAVSLMEDAIEARQAIAESEARWRQLADAMPQIVWTAGPDGEIDYLNRRWTEFTGLPQTVGSGAWAQFLHPDDAQPAGERWAACLAGGAAFDMEIRLFDQQRQSYRWHLIRTMPVRDEAGNVVRWFGSSTDIHEQKRAEETARYLAEASSALAAVEDYDATLEKIAWLAVPFFADWCIVDVSESDGSLRRLAVAHIDPQKLRLADELRQQYPPDPDEPHGPHRVMRTGQSEMMEEIPEALIVQAAKDAEHLRILQALGLKSYLCVPLRGRGSTLGVITFVSAESGRRYTKADLTLAEEVAQRSAIAIENAQLYAKLQDADRRKDEFLATLAHELRNPLAPLRNALELIRLSAGDASMLDQARSLMGRQVDQMVRLIDDLLDISRITQGKLLLRKERVEIAAVVQSAVETSRPLIEASAHELTVMAPLEPIYLEADQVRLAQVIANLLTNAAKYTEQGGQISLTVQRQHGQAMISVRDTGIGIPADHLSHIFEMFSQVAPALERAQGGLGIGLALVKGLVELHGGTVEARSEGAGMGSEFIVRLPVLEVPAPAFNPGHNGGTSRRAAKRRILVVDDNRDAAETTAMILRLMGHDTHTAHDGLEALQAAATLRPSVLLLDIGLPKMNGYEAARRIRQEPWGSDVTLIALTGWGQEEDKRRALEAGFDHHLTKPAGAAALEKVLGLAAATQYQPGPADAISMEDEKRRND